MSATAAAPATPAELPPNPSLNPPRFIYKIVVADEWQSTFEQEGKYTGGALDKNDGFIHISSAETTARTAELYFPSFKDIVLIQLDVAALMPSGQLIWDWVPSRQTYFPHYYDLVGGFTQAHIVKITPITRDEATGKHIIPNELLPQ